MLDRPIAEPILNGPSVVSGVRQCVSAGRAEQGKVQQAPELIAPVYGWFTEGFDTRDLKDAKELLEELAA
jgi:hypothetical protein